MNLFHDLCYVCPGKKKGPCIKLVITMEMEIVEMSDTGQVWLEASQPGKDLINDQILNCDLSFHSAGTHSLKGKGGHCFAKIP